MFDIKEIKDPSFLKKLKNKELEFLAEDIRSFLIENISKTGGHLASNLGVVELTIAMHYVFDSPIDKMIFDVGHQAYIHKILTGRAKDFSSLRQFQGLSGFQNRKESDHDCFETGHASSSISAMAGFLQAKKEGINIGEVIGVIGDSSIAGGMAFEALNYLGTLKEQHPIIILNDNKMGISKSVGSMARVLTKIRGTGFVIQFKKITYRIMPSFFINFCRRIKRGVKGFVQQSNIFEDLGFQYIGPVDGNDLHSVIKNLKKAKALKMPCVVHVITEKGKGYKQAEDDRYGDYHGVPAFDIETGFPVKKRENDLHSWSKIVSESIIKLEPDHKIDVVIPAMITGSKFGTFKNLYPDKIMDVGIAEEHAATMASALALSGVNVFLPIYSTFAQRAYDQINNDICRQNAHVVIGIDRAGIVGEDGETHQGVFDIAYLGHIPNIIITMPSTEDETYSLLKYGFEQNNPFVIRYPRGSVTNNLQNFKDLEIKKPKWNQLTDGNDLVIISYGPNVRMIEKLVIDHKINASVINALFIKPMDNNMLIQLAKLNKPILVYEEVVKDGSLSSKIALFYAENNISVNLSFMVLDDKYIPHGDIKTLKKELKMDEESILDRISDLLNEN